MKLLVKELSRERVYELTGTNNDYELHQFFEKNKIRNANDLLPFSRKNIRQFIKKDYGVTIAQAIERRKLCKFGSEKHDFYTAIINEISVVEHGLSVEGICLTVCLTVCGEMYSIMHYAFEEDHPDLFRHALKKSMKNIMEGVVLQSRCIDCMDLESVGIATQGAMDNLSKQSNSVMQSLKIIVGIYNHLWDITVKEEVDTEISLFKNTAKAMMQFEKAYPLNDMEKELAISAAKQMYEKALMQVDFKTFFITEGTLEAV